MYLLVEHLVQSQSSLSPSGERILLSYFYIVLGCDGFFREAIGKNNLLHLPFVYGIKCYEEDYE